jgi:hypothetical protein
MASEISLSFSMRAKKDSVYLDTGTISKSLTVDMAGSKENRVTQAVGTTYEAVAFNGDMASAGYCWMRNQDPTNYVEIGLEVSAAFYPFVKLLPGQIGLVPLSSATIFAKANTAPCNLALVLLER